MKEIFFNHGEQDVEPGEHAQADRQGQCRRAGRVIRHVPVDDVSAGQEQTTADEEPAFDLHGKTRSYFFAAVRAGMVCSRPCEAPAVHDVRVVQVERGALGADARDAVEVVPRRRAGGRPLQRGGEAPGVLLRHLLAEPRGDVHVPDEHEHRDREQPGADGGDDVQRGDVARQERVVRRAADLALDARPVLHQERHVEPDEQHPELGLAQLGVEHLAGHLRPPEVEPGEHLEEHRAGQHVVEVRHDEVGVGDREVHRRRGQDDAGDAAEQEDHQEADGVQHRRLERDLAAPHGARPVEELHARGHRDQQRHEREERQQHRAGGEHVVRPHGHRQAGDRDGGGDQGLVAEQRLAAEHREDLGRDAEERQRQDVDLGMAEEPEEVLPQHRAARLRRRRPARRGGGRSPAPAGRRRAPGTRAGPASR